MAAIDVTLDRGPLLRLADVRLTTGTLGKAPSTVTTPVRVVGGGR